MEVDIILLAGGGSRRFARASSEAGGRKLLALWRGKPLFHWALDAPPPDEGIAASARAGAAAAREGAALCFFVCDQPEFPRELFTRFVEGFCSSGLPLGRVRAGDRMGSPTAFRPELRGELMALRGDEGGRALFRGREGET